MSSVEQNGRSKPERHLFYKEVAAPSDQAKLSVKMKAEVYEQLNNHS